MRACLATDERWSTVWWNVAEGYLRGLMARGFTIAAIDRYAAQRLTLLSPE